MVSLQKEGALANDSNDLKQVSGFYRNDKHLGRVATIRGYWLVIGSSPVFTIIGYAEWIVSYFDF